MLESRHALIRLGISRSAFDFRFILLLSPLGICLQSVFASQFPSIAVSAFYGHRQFLLRFCLLLGRAIIDLQFYDVYLY